MRLGILNMRHLIVGQVRIKIITSITGGKESNPLPQPRWTGQFCKQNKLDKSSNFAVNAEHAMEERSQSQSYFENKVGEGFRLFDFSFLIEQLKRGCCTCETITNLKA